MAMNVQTADLPREVAQVLGDFVQAARDSFGGDLVSVVLFGSGANDLGNFGPSPVVNASVYLKNMSTGEVFDMVPEKTPMVANSKGSDADMSGNARFVVFASNGGCCCC